MAVDRMAPRPHEARNDTGRGEGAGAKLHARVRAPFLRRDRVGVVVRERQDTAGLRTLARRSPEEPLETGVHVHGGPGVTDAGHVDGLERLDTNVDDAFPLKRRIVRGPNADGHVTSTIALTAGARDGPRRSGGA